jgi:murein DD-endopeptidase MepM/ murein hydrolase activator NlpD
MGQQSRGDRRQVGLVTARRCSLPAGLAGLLFFLVLVLSFGLADAADSRSKPPAKAKGVTHVVKQGETLFRISQAYEVKVALLLEANRLKPSAALKVGQRLFIPGATVVKTVAPFSPLSREEKASLEATLRVEPPLPVSSPLVPSGPQPLPAPSPPPPPRTRVRTEAEFVWPIEGPINSSFGPRGGRLHAGIDIGSPHYQEVVAAADAEVIYANDSGGPLGKAVVLQHGGGLRTVYAHLSIIIASEGETVRQGQAVGGVGDTGRTTGPHLHFEVRKNGVPLNPLDFLPATIDELVRDLSKPRPATPAPDPPR